MLVFYEVCKYPSKTNKSIMGEKLTKKTKTSDKYQNLYFLLWEDKNNATIFSIYHKSNEQKEIEIPIAIEKTRH